MVRHSSTSSSEPRSRPWALRALLALLVAGVLLVAADRVIMRSPATWTHLHARIPLDSAMEFWISFAQRDRARFAREPDDRIRLVALGSSRTTSAFQPGTLPDSDALWLRTASLGCAALDAFALRSMVDGVVDLDPDVVVLFLSEFDTHRPLLLVPRLIDPDLPSLVELLRHTDSSYVWKERHGLLEILAGGILETYRYRATLRTAGLGRFSEFEMGMRDLEPSPARVRDHSFGSRRHAQWESEEFLELRDEIEIAHGGEIPFGEFQQLYSITRGPQVHAQESFLESAIVRLRRSGVQVLIFETPLNPLGARLWDTDLREDFVAFARRMERSHGVWFMPLEESGPYGQDQFADLTHLNYPGATLATERLVDRLYHELRNTPEAMIRSGLGSLHPAMGPPRAPQVDSTRGKAYLKRALQRHRRRREEPGYPAPAPLSE